MTMTVQQQQETAKEYRTVVQASGKSAFLISIPKAFANRLGLQRHNQMSFEFLKVKDSQLLVLRKES
jgi:hypothetical protein